MKMTEVKEKKKKKSLFKRWWFWVIVVIVVGGIASSGSDTDDTDKITDEGATTSETATNDDSITAEKSTAAKEEKAPEAEPVQVYSDANVTISYKSADENGVKFLVENKRGKSLTVQANSVSVNGFSSNDIMMSDDISPNSKGYATAETTELADAGTPEKISGSLVVLDSESFDTLANVNFTDVPVNK
jgi:hypothetical protein